MVPVWTALGAGFPAPRHHAETARLEGVGTRRTRLLFFDSSQSHLSLMQRVHVSFAVNIISDTDVAARIPTLTLRPSPHASRGDGAGVPLLGTCPKHIHL